MPDTVHITCGKNQSYHEILQYTQAPLPLFDLGFVDAVLLCICCSFHYFWDTCTAIQLLLRHQTLNERNPCYSLHICGTSLRGLWPCFYSSLSVSFVLSFFDLCSGCVTFVFYFYNCVQSFPISITLTAATMPTARWHKLILYGVTTEDEIAWHSYKPKSLKKLWDSKVHLCSYYKALVLLLTTHKNLRLHQVNRKVSWPISDVTYLSFSGLTQILSCETSERGKKTNSQFHNLPRNSSTCRWKCVSKYQILLPNEAILQKNTERTDFEGCSGIENQFRTAVGIYCFIATALFHMVKEWPRSSGNLMKFEDKWKS